MIRLSIWEQNGFGEKVFFDNSGQISSYFVLGEGFRKKQKKVWPFAKLGGGARRVVKKPNLYFGNVFLH